MRHLTLAELEAGLDTIRESPTDDGVLELIVRRPATDAREVMEAAELDAFGLVGDRWGARARERRLDHRLNTETELTLINARVIALIAGARARWPLAGDQLFLDLDLSVDNLPPGTRLALGSAVLLVSEESHTGCAKFQARYGPDALTFVNSPQGRQLRLRGMYASVLQPGAIRIGDVASTLAGD
jgi:hypothetical protein